MPVSTNKDNWDEEAMNGPSAVAKPVQSEGFIFEVDGSTDTDGWMYALGWDTEENTIWSGVRKPLYTVRRRCWFRYSTKGTAPSKDGKGRRGGMALGARQSGKINTNAPDPEFGWEYAFNFGNSSQWLPDSNYRTAVRRRRWRRERQIMPGISMKGDSFGNSRLYLSRVERHSYELRCHFYQARELIAQDDSGMSDPYIRVFFYTKVM